VLLADRITGGGVALERIALKARPK
jgi:hypothetical protein